MNDSQRIIKLGLYIVMIVHLAGCASGPTAISISPPIVHVLVDQRSIPVAVSYSDDLINHYCQSNMMNVTFKSGFPLGLHNHQKIWIFRLGESSIQMLRAMIRQKFKNADFGKNASRVRSQSSLYMRVYIDDFSVCPGAEVRGLPGIHIGYRMVIKRNDSDQQINLFGSGLAEVSEFHYDGLYELKTFKFANEQFFEQLIPIAMRYALADLIVNMENSQELKNWMLEGGGDAGH